VNSQQRLLRLEFTVPTESFRLGENQVAIRVLKRPKDALEAKVVLEKLELHVQYG
jgi:hypothetical protein